MRGRDILSLRDFAYFSIAGLPIMVSLRDINTFDFLVDEKNSNQKKNLKCRNNLL